MISPERFQAIIDSLQAIDYGETIKWASVEEFVRRRKEGKEFHSLALRPAETAYMQAFGSMSRMQTHTRDGQKVKPKSASLKRHERHLLKAWKKKMSDAMEQQELEHQRLMKELQDAARA